MPYAVIPKELQGGRKNRGTTLVTLLLIGFTGLAHSAGHPQTGVQGGFASPAPSANTNAAISKGTLAAEDQRHWQDFLKLAAKPNAMVTTRDVESAFGQRMVPDSRTSAYGIPDAIGYFEHETPRFRRLYPGRKQLFIGLVLHDTDPQTCLSETQVATDLQKAGWTPRSHEPDRNVVGVDKLRLHLSAEDTFLKGDQGILDLIYPKGCAYFPALQANKLEFDQITDASEHQVATTGSNLDRSMSRQTRNDFSGSSSPTTHQAYVYLMRDINSSPALINQMNRDVGRNLIRHFAWMTPSTGGVLLNASTPDGPTLVMDMNQFLLDTGSPSTATIASYNEVFMIGHALGHAELADPSTNPLGITPTEAKHNMEEATKKIIASGPNDFTSVMRTYLSYQLHSEGFASIIGFNDMVSEFDAQNDITRPTPDDVQSTYNWLSRTWYGGFSLQQSGAGMAALKAGLIAN